MSSAFIRTFHAPAEVSAKCLSETLPVVVDKNVDYALVVDIETEVNKYPAPVTLAGLDKVLGERITRLFLHTDSEATLRIAAKVLSDHSKTNGSKKEKDLQANLMVNIIKEVVDTKATTHSERFSECTDLLRRCSLDLDFKKHLSKILIDDNVVASPSLAVLERT